jgi:putative membrane protein
VVVKEAIGMMNGGGSASMAGWMIVGLVVWIALIVLAGLAVGRYLQGPPPGRELPPRDTPLDLLERRYAEGAIDREEFDEAKARLR